MLRLFAIIGLLILIIAVGTAGFHIIEGWTFGESIYMTFITATTVGFGEVRPLSAAGRNFTIGLIILSIATVGYSVSTVVSYIFEGQIVRTIKERNMLKSISRLKNHYIICGYGDVGRSVATEFNRDKVKYVVIEKNPEKFTGTSTDVPYIIGDAAEDDVLLDAQLNRASGLISTLPDDESNVFVVLTARQLNPEIMIVSQARDDRSERKLKKAGANRVVSAPTIAGQRMAAIALRPSVTEFLEVVMRSGETEMRIEQIALTEKSALAGRSLRESGVGQETGALVIGIIKADGQTRVNPTETAMLSNMKLSHGDILIAMGSIEQLQRMKVFVEGV